MAVGLREKGGRAGGRKGFAGICKERSRFGQVRAKT